VDRNGNLRRPRVLVNRARAPHSPLFRRQLRKVAEPVLRILLQPITLTALQMAPDLGVRLCVAGDAARGCAGDERGDSDRAERTQQRFEDA
jgi:hypothetical protein